jgi:hypothetical protein
MRFVVNIHINNLGRASAKPKLGLNSHVYMHVRLQFSHLCVYFMQLRDEGHALNSCATLFCSLGCIYANICVALRDNKKGGAQRGIVDLP